MAQVDHEAGSFLRKALRKLYPLPQYAVLYEVANGMGETFSGYADAIVMGLFPSRGLDIQGFEIKTSRRDWLSELKKPRKADRIARFCDRWWLLTGSEDVARKEELPEPWGLYTYRNGTLDLVKRAKRLKAIPPDREFVAAMLRRANEMVEREKERISETLDKDAFAQKVRREAEKEAEAQHEQDLKIRTREHEALKREVEDFEKASGIRINQWNGARMGEAVQQLLAINNPRELDVMERECTDLEQKAKALREGIVQLKSVATSFLGTARLPT